MLQFHPIIPTDNAGVSREGMGRGQRFDLGTDCGRARLESLEVVLAQEASFVVEDDAQNGRRSCRRSPQGGVIVASTYVRVNHLDQPSFPPEHVNQIELILGVPTMSDLD